MPHYTALTLLKYRRLSKLIKRRVPASVPRTMFFKFDLATRWLLRQPYLLSKNPQLRLTDLLRNKTYQRLFGRGYAMSGAHNFFMHRGINQGKYSNLKVFIKYNHILNDITKFKTWNLKGFRMRPIYMKRLLGLYFGEEDRSAYKSLTKAVQFKSKRISAFFNLFQYSLLAVAYQAFRLMGVARLLHYIKSGYFYKNGVVSKDPFIQCFPGDLIQLNLFSLFIEPWGSDQSKAFRKYNDFLKIKKTTAWYITRTAHLTLILSYFRNFLVKRTFRKKRYSKVVYNSAIISTRREFSQFLNRIIEFPFQLYYFYPGSRLNLAEPSSPMVRDDYMVSEKQIELSDQLTTFLEDLVKYQCFVSDSIKTLSSFIKIYTSLQAYLVACFWVSLVEAPEEADMGYPLIESKADNLLRTGLDKKTWADPVATKATPKKNKWQKPEKAKPMRINNLRFYKNKVLKKWRDYISQAGTYLPQKPSAALPLFLWQLYTLDRFFRLKRVVTSVLKSGPKTRPDYFKTPWSDESERILRNYWREVDGHPVSLSGHFTYLGKPSLRSRQHSMASRLPMVFQRSQLNRVIRQRSVDIANSQSIAKSQKSWWRWHSNLTKESLVVDEDVAGLSLVSRHVRIKGRRSFLNRDGIRFLLSFTL